MTQCDGESTVGGEDRPVGSGGQGDATGLDRRRTAALVLPFVLLGVADVALVVGWGIRPAWGLLVFPPVAFVCTVAWITFRGGFLEDRAEQ